MAAPAGNADRIIVASSATAVQLRPAVRNRKYLRIVNKSTAILYVQLGSGTPSSTEHTVELASNAAWELPVAYGGAIQGIWASANGNAVITELT